MEKRFQKLKKKEKIPDLTHHKKAKNGKILQHDHCAVEIKQRGNSS